MTESNIVTYRFMFDNVISVCTCGKFSSLKDLLAIQRQTQTQFESLCTTSSLLETGARLILLRLSRAIAREIRVHISLRLSVILYRRQRGECGHCHDTQSRFKDSGLGRIYCPIMPAILWIPVVLRFILRLFPRTNFLLPHFLTHTPRDANECRCTVRKWQVVAYEVDDFRVKS